MHQPARPERRFIPRRTGDATPLGHLEAAVMEACWARRGPLTVSEVHEALPAEPRVAYNTVKTTMERLAGKGILSREKEGKAYIYRASVSREELERRIVAGALDRLVEEFPRAVASFFARPDAGLSAEKMALLMDAIERSREERDG